MYYMMKNEAELDVCNVSTEYKEGWRAISILIDSGASDSVAPKSFFPDIPRMETNASRSGLTYTAAGGRKIVNEGMSRPVFCTEKGKPMVMNFQIAEVSKALGAVSRIVGKNNRIIFGDPEKDGSYIEDKTTKNRTPLRQHNGVYYLDVWVRPGEYYSGFQR